jgi:uncharacterized protein
VTRFHEVFPKGKAFLPVIHAESFDQVCRNVCIARTNGADGVFLISHGKLNAQELITAYHHARIEHFDWWIGLNFLDLPEPTEAFACLPDCADGLWSDNAGVEERTSDPIWFPRAFKNLRDEKQWTGLYFGGVAFKYQPYVERPDYAANLAAPFVDVVTTSGPSTGSAPDMTKVQAMHEGLEGHPLGIASGITPENVSRFLPFTQAFLVSTGISRNHTELDPARVRLLANLIHQ